MNYFFFFLAWLPHCIYRSITGKLRVIWMYLFKPGYYALFSQSHRKISQIHLRLKLDCTSGSSLEYTNAYVTVSTSDADGRCIFSDSTCLSSIFPFSHGGFCYLTQTSCAGPWPVCDLTFSRRDKQTIFNVAFFHLEKYEDYASYFSWFCTISGCLLWEKSYTSSSGSFFGYWMQPVSSSLLFCCSTSFLSLPCKLFVSPIFLHYWE